MYSSSISRPYATYKINKIFDKKKDDIISYLFNDDKITAMRKMHCLIILRKTLYNYSN